MALTGDRVSPAGRARLSGAGLLIVMAPAVVIVAIVRVARLDSAGLDFRYAYVPAPRRAAGRRRPPPTTGGRSSPLETTPGSTGCGHSRSPPQPAAAAAAAGEGR